jgi:hypothetical protein
MVCKLSAGIFEPQLWLEDCKLVNDQTKDNIFPLKEADDVLISFEGSRYVLIKRFILMGMHSDVRVDARPFQVPAQRKRGRPMKQRDISSIVASQVIGFEEKGMLSSTLKPFQNSNHGKIRRIQSSA